MTPTNPTAARGAARANAVETPSASPEIRTLETSVGTLQYYETGAGAPLLFVHGLFTNMHLWRKIVPELSRDYRCIVPTLPFGAHSVPVRDDVDLSPPALAGLLFEIIAGLGLKDVTLLANDTGGALTQLALAERPDHPAIAGAIFTNCDAFEVFPPARFLYLRWISYLPLIPTLLAWQMRFDIVRRLPIALGGLTKYRLSRESLEEYAGPFSKNARIRNNTTKIMRDIHPRYTRAAAKKLSSFRRPVLLAWAPEDKLFPLRLAEGLNDLFAESEIKLVADSGAFIPEDQPAALIAIVREFKATRA
ncbi:MAG: alpha/beta fold hydrolase [Leptospirales bacterium]|jgi:pimeloyl-ACP methyl ester carboxylesterase